MTIFLTLFSFIMALWLSLLLLQASSQFWAYWSDGKAELDYYTGTQLRYGETRKCSTVLIYVTEQFNAEKQVKADNADSKNAAQTSVLKLNHIKRFQTGIYAYSVMSSVFTPLVASTVQSTRYEAGAPLKMTFTSQEWCGMTFQQLNRQADKSMKSRSQSYFETEGDHDESLPANETTLFANDLFIAVRELVKPLQTGAATLYPTLERARLSHKPLAAEQATISKKQVDARVQGKPVAAVEWTIATQSASWMFTVETQYPRRIVAFTYTENGKTVEHAELRTTKRLPYWQLNKLADEHYWTELSKQ
jgi:hypothetical protein